MIHPEQQRRAYLKAMGIDVWLPRDTVDDAGGTPQRSLQARWSVLILLQEVPGGRNCALA